MAPAAIPSAQISTRLRTKERRRVARTIREHIGHHTNFIMYRRAGPDEFVELLVNRSFSPPFNERVENELVASYNIPVRQSRATMYARGLTICVLLPPRQFIYNGERHPLFETTFGVGSPSQSITFQKEAKGHVEIFRYIRL